MAHDGTGTGWAETDPTDSEKLKDAAKEIRDLRKALRIRLEYEHTTPATSSVGGVHKNGSAVCYYGGSAPTQRPDAATALDNSGDRGRLWVDGGVLKYWNGSAWTAISASSAYSVATLKDVKAAGTTGGSFTAGSWTTRTLNTEVDASGIVTLSSNQFTLAAGTYEIWASAPMFAATGHQARLYNVSDAAVEILGSAEYSTGTNNQTSSYITGVFTISGSKTFRIEHRTEANATAGRAPSSAFGVSVVYTQVVIRKLS